MTKKISRIFLLVSMLNLLLATSSMVFSRVLFGIEPLFYLWTALIFGVWGGVYAISAVNETLENGVVVKAIAKKEEE